MSSRNPNLPKVDGLPFWPEFEPSSQLYMELNTPPVVKDHLKAEDVKFWLETVPALADKYNKRESKDEL